METNEQIDLIRAEYKGGKVVITMPMRLLQFTQKNRPDIPAFIIKKKDLRKAGEWVAAHILEFDEQEDGTTRLQQLIDDLFESAYEDGADWIKEDGEDE